MAALRLVSGGVGGPVAGGAAVPPGPIPNPVVTQRSAGEYCGGDPTGGEAAAGTPHPRRRDDATSREPRARGASRHEPRTRRGVEQRQLVGLITQRSGVRIPPPLPDVNAGTIRCRRCCIFQQTLVCRIRSNSRPRAWTSGESSTPSATLSNLLLISSIRSVAPDAGGAVPGFAPTAVRRCPSSDLLGATDAVCRPSIPVASARRHPRISSR